MEVLRKGRELSSNCVGECSFCGAIYRQPMSESQADSRCENCDTHVTFFAEGGKIGKSIIDNMEFDDLFILG